VLDSVRSRLALWHTAVLAVLLIGFATASDLWLERVVVRRDDRFLEEATSAFHSNLAAELSELPLDSAVAQSFAEFKLRDVSFVVLDGTGHVIGHSAPALERSRRADEHERERAPRELDTARVRDAAFGLARQPGDRLATIGLARRARRLFVLPVVEGRDRFFIVGIRSLGDQRELLDDTRTGFLLAIPLGLLFAWIGGYLLARRSLAPVAAMTTRAAAIGATSLHERLPTGNPRDELGRLAQVLNDLLARLDAAFEQQRRFMADASHELRTPVSIMRGEADIALSRDVRTPEEYRGALEVVRAEGRRLSQIVGELFLLARADSGQQRLKVRALYLDDLVGDCVHVMRSIALAREVTLRCTVEPQALTNTGHEDEHAYDGDEELLRRLVVNLLDNAIKHSPRGSTVDVEVIGHAGEHVLRVIDHGAGIPAPAQALVFDRFFRADESHARDATSETGGAGLGLAIAQWVAQAHGGSLMLVSSAPGETIFEVRLTSPARHSVIASGAIPVMQP
jgi:two-component system OmpR family sensor kinase